MRRLKSIITLWKKDFILMIMFEINKIATTCLFFFPMVVILYPYSDVQVY